MTDDATPAQTLDCVGLYCPEPLFQTRESIDAIAIGEVLEVYADDPAAVVLHGDDLVPGALGEAREVFLGGQLHILIRRLK